MAPHAVAPGDTDLEADESGLRHRAEVKLHKGSAAVDSDDNEDLKAADSWAEWGDIGILMVLYTLQERGASFSDVGTFSLNSWPFSLKLFWAPLVDTVYFRRIGRRKTWLVPAQLLIGLVMMMMSTCVDSLLYAEKPDVVTLTALFFLLYLMCATQDIAVDGWALTMLRPESVGWAATCNAAGQTLGAAFGFTGYMMLEQLKLVTLASFMFILGIVFITVTVLVALLKTEKPVPPEDEPDGIVTTYRLMLSMAKLRPVQVLMVVLATWKMAFPITDAIAPLKFQENGVPKEYLAYMTSLLMPMSIVLPVIAARWTSGKAPLDLALWWYPVRVALVGATAVLAYHTQSGLEHFPHVFYLLIFLVSAATSAASQFMFVSQMAFFARVSDPALGGTYMTLLNTLANLGGMWPPTVTFFLVDGLTCKEPDCRMQSDGFYVVATLCMVIGAGWYTLGAPVVRRVQTWKLEDWRVR
mmetsp:Transcript_118993/g.379459  ORF Transcript_118993/g.379459 Transcript_118993/m.379459 type:complete len:470 (-) Transcript_118993:574-1983(-)